MQRWSSKGSIAAAPIIGEPIIREPIMGDPIIAEPIMDDPIMGELIGIEGEPIIMLPGDIMLGLWSDRGGELGARKVFEIPWPI